MVRRLAPCTALALLCVVTNAEGEPARVSLRIDCPALGDETRAVFEARAQAELASEGLPAGEVNVACDMVSATVSWSPSGGVRRERRVELALGVTAVDDAILAGLHTLLFEEGRAPSPPSALPPEPRPEERAPPPDLAAPVQLPEPRHVRAAGIVGTDAELWQGGVTIAVGAYTGLSLSLSDRWAASVDIAPQWGLGSAKGISAWGLRGEARLDYALLRVLDVGVGASARTLWANAPGAVTTQLEGLTAGAVLCARYVIPLGPVSLSVGPKVEALVRPIVVDLSGNEVFRVPSFIAGVTLDGAAP